VAGFQMVDHDLDWRDLDTVEELGDAPLLVISFFSHRLAGSRQGPREIARSLSARHDSSGRGGTAIQARPTNDRPKFA
jgi:hypothetical protein